MISDLINVEALSYEIGVLMFRGLDYDESLLESVDSMLINLGETAVDQKILEGFLTEGFGKYDEETLKGMFTEYMENYFKI